MPHKYMRILPQETADWAANHLLRQRSRSRRLGVTRALARSPAISSCTSSHVSAAFLCVHTRHAKQQPTRQQHLDHVQLTAAQRGPQELHNVGMPDADQNAQPAQSPTCVASDTQGTSNGGAG